MSTRTLPLAFVHLIVLAVLAGPLASAYGEDTTVEFVVTHADTLIGLSSSTLVSPTAWREVARINKLRDPNRIRPGQRLLIPTRLLRGALVDAKLVGASGDVRVGETLASTGAIVGEGQSVQTGPNGSAVIELADGSRIRIPPSSLAQVAVSRNYGDRLPANAAATTNQVAGGNTPGHWFAGTVRMLRGSVEVFATKMLRAKPLEVVTPTAVVGVRGTHYRVGLNDDAEAGTHVEVIEGLVRFNVADAANGSDLRAGFGAVADINTKVATIAPLLPAPELSTVPTLFERPIVRFEATNVDAPWRVQVASDAGFERIVSDLRVAVGAEIRVAGLDDALWFLRARRVDPRGIEGFDTVRPFVLKARPEPPAYRSPRSNAKQAAGVVSFSWAPNTDAPRARFQLADDNTFKRILQDQDSIEGAALKSEILKPGTYFWRLASVLSNGDRGPFGDPQTFELRPLPEPPQGGLSTDGNGLVLRWSGRAEDKQKVELARDSEFREIVAEAELTGSEWALPMPTSGGRYFFRYRSVEPDNFVGPFSAALVIDVPRNWSGFGLLLPLIFLLL